MSDFPLVPAAGMDMLAQSKMREQQNELKQLHTKLQNKASPEAQSEQEQAAEMFEGLLIKEMLKSMWNTVPEGSMLTGSREESLYRDMLNDAYAEDLSSGQGIGIKRLILEEFERK